MIRIAPMRPIVETLFRAVIAISILLVVSWATGAADAAPLQIPVPDRPGPSTGGDISINFNNVDIHVFIKYIAEQTNMNFIVDQKVRGNITIISPGKVPVDAAYRLFESVLDVHGFTTIRSGDVVKIVPTPDARFKSVETRLDQSGVADIDRIVTQIIHLKHALAEQIKKLMTPFVSKNSVIIAYPPTNLIIVTDVSSNIKRLMRILTAIDTPDSSRQFEVIQLEHADALTLEKTLKAVMQPGRAKKGAAVRRDLSAIAYPPTNALLLLGEESDNQRLRNLVEALDVPPEKVKSKYHVYYLEHASAEDLAAVLKELSGSAPGGGKDQKKKKIGGISGDVIISPDSATNSLIILAAQEDYAAVEDIVAKLDIPRSMVYIECLIMEVDTQKQFKVGVEWQGAGSTTIDGRPGVVTGGFSGNSYENTGNLAATGALPDGLSLGIFSEGVTIGGVTFPNVAAIAQAYQQDKDINIISTPQLLTMDNKEAVISVGKNVPYQTTASTIDNQTFNSFEYRDVGTTLKITPQINQERMVRLQITQELTKLESEIGDPRPTTLKRSITTTVTVKDSDTIVIGGLIDEASSDTINKVPLLGDIPVLGWLFKSKAAGDEKTNLYVFLTPRVVLHPSEATGIYQDKRREMEQMDEEELERYKKRLKDLISSRSSISPGDSDAFLGGME